MATYFRFEFLFDPATLDVVSIPRWQDYTGTSEGETEFVDCTSATYFDVVDGVDTSETWTTDGLFIDGLTPDPVTWFTWKTDLATLTPTAAFLALGTPTAIKAQIITTDLRPENNYGATAGSITAYTSGDYGFANIPFTFSQMEGTWLLADLRDPENAFSYFTCNASEATSG